MKFIPDQSMTLLECLHRLYPDCSNKTLKNFLKEGRVWVSGKLAKIPAMIIQTGKAVEVRRERFVSQNLSHARVLFEDEHLLVSDKTERFLSVGTDKERTKTAFHEILHYLTQKNADARLYVVHRLDFGTSGLLMFAKTETARDGLKDLFASRHIERHYRAVVEGYPVPEQGTLENHLSESQTLRVYVTHHKTLGKHAITHYKVMQKGKVCSLLDLKLETGRRGQIRVQLANKGYPIVGDHQYGSPWDPLGRFCLHACKLAFQHPITDKNMSFESAMPASFARLLSMDSKVATSRKA